MYGILLGALHFPNFFNGVRVARTKVKLQRPESRNKIKAGKTRKLERPESRKNQKKSEWSGMTQEWSLRQYTGAPMPIRQ
jgi:hypothetical protein